MNNEVVEANVEHQEHGLEQQRALRRKAFNSFLFSDDESTVPPGRKVCHARYYGDHGSECGDDDDGEGARHDWHHSRTGTRRAACSAKGDFSHVFPVTAVGRAGVGSSAASVVTQSSLCNGDDEYSRGRSPSRSPTGLVGTEEKVITSRTDTPPVDEDGERGGHTPWNPPTATARNKAPPRGRAGWSQAATRHLRDAHNNGSDNGSKGVGGASLQEAYSPYGNNSLWEVSKRVWVGRSLSISSSLSSSFAVS